MKKEFWPKRLMIPKLLMLGLVTILALGISTTALAGGRITGDDIFKFTDEGAVKGGIFRTQWGPPRSFDPDFATATDGTNVASIVYNGLLRITQKWDGIELDLAESWRQIDDLTYEFKLKKGVHWQNVPPVNGREFTSADVKYSIERHAGLQLGEKEKKSKFRKTYYFDRLASIETPDKYTVIFKTSVPDARFINYIASSWTSMIPKEAVAEFKTLDLKGIGTGPFIMTEHVRGSHVNFKRNDNFFRKSQGLPRLDGINVKFMRQPATIMAAFLAGELDYALLQPEQVDTVLKEAPETNVYVRPALYTTIVRTPPWWVSDDGTVKVPLEPPWNDKRVRQAVAHAINKQRLLELYNGGEGKPAIGPVPRVYKPWALSEKDQTKFDPELSKKLLAEAGVPNGFATEIMTWNLPGMTGPAQIIKEMLGQVGINATINALDFAQYFNKVYRFKYQMCYHVTTAGFDPDEWLSPYYGIADRSNYYKWSNKELWKLIEDQKTILDKEKRLALVQKIQRMVMDDPCQQSMYAVNYQSAYKPYCHPKQYIHEATGYISIERFWMDKH